jgi:hypothetical protein
VRFVDTYHPDQNKRAVKRLDKQPLSPRSLALKEDEKILFKGKPVYMSYNPGLYINPAVTMKAYQQEVDKINKNIKEERASGVFTEVSYLTLLTYPCRKASKSR